MGINIKNDEVEALIRAYAEEQGVGVTEAIRRAVEVARIGDDAVRKARAARRLAAFDGRLKALGGPWCLDQQAADEEYFDEHGLPR